MKILSVIVPSYNSEGYLSNCIESLLNSGDNIEILIVNDGSIDTTKTIADQYEKNYPDKIKAIHQENAGHGGAVNTGIEHASGKYIKVVDSDDWVNPEKLKVVVKKLLGFYNNDTPVDMIIGNFMYDNSEVKNKKIMHYRGILPTDRIITWDEVGAFKSGKYILMHSVIYNIDVIKKSKLILPKHTFYVDNLFVYLPLPFVENLYYIDECIYHYFIGREDQSVNEKNMIKRIDQQLAVNKIMFEGVDLNLIDNKRKRAYMRRYLNIVTAISSIFLLKDGSDEAIDKKKELWKTIKEQDYKLYMWMRASVTGNLLNLPGKGGRKVSLIAYKAVKQVVGFN